MTVDLGTGDLAYALSGYGRKTNPYDARRRSAYSMIQQGTDTSPILSPWQGAARLAQALAGNLDLYMVDRDEKAADKKRSDALAQAMAEPDPQKRIGLIAAYDPDTGARAAGQLAVEQAKLGQQKEALRTGASTFGASFGAAPQTFSVQPLPPSGGSGGGYYGTLAAGESGGDYNVPNAQGSGAYGKYQFMPQTWATVARANPQLGLPTDMRQATPEHQEAAVRALTGMNAQSLQTAGLPVNPTTLALAHWVGADGATKILQASPDTPLSTLLDPQALQLNPGLRTTAGGLVQSLGQRYQGVASPTGAPQQQPGPPMSGPQPVMQGGGDTTGMPPAPSAAGIAGPTLTAPAVPNVPRPQPTPQMIQQYQQRYAAGEFGTNPAEAGSRARAAMDAELDRQWGVQREQANTRYQQQFEDYKHQRGLQDKEANLTQATPEEMQKLRTARAEGTAIIGALGDYKTEFEKGPGFRSLLGAATPANTAYNNATLLMKGEALYNLGVLSGPDLDIIRRTLPDPSTFAGQHTRVEDMRTAVDKITNLINARIAAKEAQLGAPPSSGAPAPPSGNVPPPPSGFRVVQ